MNRSKCYGLCFFLLLAKTVVPGPLSAEDQLRARFLAEGPKGWKVLKSNVRELQGKWIGRYKLGVHPLIIEEATFKVNGGFLVYEERRREEKGQVDRVVAFGANSKYRFALQQPRPSSSWTLVNVGSAADPHRIDHPYSRASGVGFLRFLHTPFTVNSMPIPVMITEAGFKLEKVGELTRDGRKLAKIEFTYTPPKINVEVVNGRPVRRDMHMTKMRGGWMVLDPERNWSLQESSLDLVGGEKNTCIVEYAKSDSGVFLPSRVFEKDNAVSVWEVTFSDLTIRDIPEKEFTLTAYGLPEPMGVVWPSPTRWYLWITLAAVGAVVLGFVLRKLQRRYQTPKAVEPAKQ